jgi:hypothetical protein
LNPKRRYAPFELHEILHNIAAAVLSSHFLYLSSAALIFNSSILKEQLPPKGDHFTTYSFLFLLQILSIVQEDQAVRRFVRRFKILSQKAKNKAKLLAADSHQSENLEQPAASSPVGDDDENQSIDDLDNIGELKERESFMSDQKGADSPSALPPPQSLATDAMKKAFIFHENVVCLLLDLLVHFLPSPQALSSDFPAPLVSSVPTNDWSEGQSFSPWMPQRDVILSIKSLLTLLKCSNGAIGTSSHHRRLKLTILITFPLTSFIAVITSPQYPRIIQSLTISFHLPPEDQMLLSEVSKFFFLINPFSTLFFHLVFELYSFPHIFSFRSHLRISFEIC